MCFDSEKKENDAKRQSDDIIHYGLKRLTDYRCTGCWSAVSLLTVGLSDKSPAMLAGLLSSASRSSSSLRTPLARKTSTESLQGNTTFFRGCSTAFYLWAVQPSVADKNGDDK